MRRLREVEEPLAEFLGPRASSILRDKLGPILWQFPPNFKYDWARWRRSVTCCRITRDAGRAIARKRLCVDERTHSACHGRESASFRHAIEIRHESFLDPTFVDLLREHNVGSRHRGNGAPLAGWCTTLRRDFVYMRLHGDKETLSKRIIRIRRSRRWGTPESGRGIAVQSRRTAIRYRPKRPPKAKSRDVYCFFDNTDVKLRAPTRMRTP